MAAPRFWLSRDGWAQMRVYLGVFEPRGRVESGVTVTPDGDVRRCSVWSYWF